MRILEATPERREFIRRLSRRVFAHFGDYETLLPRLMRMPWVHTAIAEIDDDPVGFAMYSLEDASRGEVDLIAIAVEPERQRQGVARTLLSHVEAEASRWLAGMQGAHLKLTVAVDNTRARRLFESRGFRRVPGRRGFYAGGQRSIDLRKPVGSDAPSG